MWLHYAKSDLGVALIDSGACVEGEALLQEFMGWADGAGNSFNRPYLIAALAGSYAAAGDWERALSELARARQFGIRNGETWFNAELSRLRGEYLWQSARQNEAAHEFEEARRIARAGNARLWELRATTSLAALHRSAGSMADVHALLVPVLANFPEGRETPHLVAARRLLSPRGV